MESREDFFKDNFLKKILFIHERHTERGRGRRRLPAGSQMWDSIVGDSRQDQDLGGRQRLND